MRRSCKMIWGGGGGWVGKKERKEQKEIDKNKDVIHWVKNCVKSKQQPWTIILLVYVGSIVDLIGFKKYK